MSAPSVPVTSPSAQVGSRRRLVLGCALAMLAVKLVVAATTYGTRDINHWRDFVNAVHQHGPIGIYGVTFPSSFYNHPPLIGYLLAAVDFGRMHGVTLQFSIRALSSLADVGTTILIFELLRRRRPLREATAAGVLVALSPVLFVISGYHGNTDPIFTLLSLLALYLLADRDRPALAGLAIALAVGVKVVPVVFIPLLAVLAWRRGPRAFLRFSVTGATAFCAVWLPALVTHGHQVKTNVLGYAGSNIPQWGLIQIGHWFGDPRWAGFLAGSGRFPIVVLCALAPAALVYVRPDRAAEALGLAAVAFLFLSPAFGSQYTVWAMAPAYLLGLRLATFYNLFTGALLIEVYSRWNHWHAWDFANQWGFNRAEVIGFLIAWLSLGVILVDAAVRLARERGQPDSSRAGMQSRATDDPVIGSASRPSATVPD